MNEIDKSELLKQIHELENVFYLSLIKSTARVHQNDLEGVCDALCKPKREIDLIIERFFT